jgi:hypothetical protein
MKRTIASMILLLSTLSFGADIFVAPNDQAYIKRRGKPNKKVLSENSSGNVGVGTGKPSSLLHLYSKSSGGTAQSRAALIIEDTQSNGDSIQFLSDDTGFQSIYFGDASDNDVGRIAYDHTGNAMRFNVNAGERMRIDSAGDVGIGATNPVYALDIERSSANAEAALHSNGGSGRNWVLQSRTDGKFQINDDTAGQGRIAIDSNGYVGINETSPSAFLHADGESESAIVQLLQRATNANWVTSYETSNTTDTSFPWVRFRNGDPTTVGQITSNLTTDTTTYGTSSDSRLKRDLGAWKAMDMLNSVPARKYERLKNPGTPHYGFFAQELHRTVPDAVIKGGKDPRENPWMIDYGKVTGILWKALQEQRRCPRKTLQLGG